MNTFRNSNLFHVIFVVVACALIFTIVMPNHADAGKSKFKLLWSIYVGWMPYYYMDVSGILDKWADAYGVEIEVVEMGYGESIGAFASGEGDALTVTNMDQLIGPAAAGLDATVVIIGDYSNGNDGILVKDSSIINASNLMNYDMTMVEGSVSEYLACRYVQENGGNIKRLRVENRSDKFIESSLPTAEAESVAVTWNPILMNLKQNPDLDEIYNSSQIPGEILDNLIINTASLKKPGGENFAKAVVGAWYEMMQIMSRRQSPEAKKAKEFMAEHSPCSVPEFEAQLSTTFLFSTPKSAVEYARGAEIKEKMDKVSQECFDRGLIQLAKTVDALGILYPDGTVQGNPKNIKMRFDTSFMQMAADGLLKR